MDIPAPPVGALAKLACQLLHPLVSEDILQSTDLRGREPGNVATGGESQ